MKYLAIANLQIFNTLNCNFKCDHCMLGDTVNEKITKEVIEKAFENIIAVGVLRFIGGESLMNPQSLKDTLEVIKKNKTLLYKLRITTNGSLYSDEIESILDEYEKYIEICRKEFPKCNFTVEEGKSVGVIFSADEYHEKYMNELELSNPDLAYTYYENMNKLFASKYFYHSRDLGGIFKTGKAVNLKDAYDEVDNYKSFYYESDESIYAAPCINILTDGTLTEHNGSIKDLKTKFNYGNILISNLEDLIRATLEKCDTYEEFNDKQFAETGRFNDLSEANYKKRLLQKRLVKRKNKKTYLT